MYPLADIDWLIGSPEAPELKFDPVEFDADKFTSDIMADPPPGKKGESDAKPDGEWTDGAKGEQTYQPEVRAGGEGLPANKEKEEDLSRLPEEQKYMRALDEMSKLKDVKPKRFLRT